MNPASVLILKSPAEHWVARHLHEDRYAEQFAALYGLIYMAALTIAGEVARAAA